MNSEGRRSALLCIGSVNHLNGIQQGRGDGVLILVSVPPLESVFAANTVLFPFNSARQVAYRAIDMLGQTVAEGEVSLNRLFVEMQVGPELRTALAGRVALGSVSPIFYVSWDEAAGVGRQMHIYSQVRFSRGDALFIRTSPEPYVWVGDSLSWFDEATRLHAVDPVFLNNHQCYYKKCFSGKELENKFTLEPPAEIWGLTVEIYKRLRAGELAGYLMEYRDEFQQWDYYNYLFEIPTPASEQGYISFIPTTDGRYTIKRKWYGGDTFVRGETHRKGVTIDVPFAEFIRSEYGLEPHELPPFRRVRYDVNIESMRTGHVYGIFFDHCSLVSAPHVVLSQCEIEYLRSRTRVEPDEAAVMPELAEVTAWTQAFLDQNDVRYQLGYYSKLSFLKEHA